ncbi:MAG: V-type ATPase subunit [Sedimentisphaerales bacterium]|nr:V-type ATPase subunit [Sedimentisphaerales bacterium]
MPQILKQAITEYFTYPDLGPEDWRYAFASAQVRALETTMLTRAVLLDMANAEDFSQALDSLSSTEYAARTFPDVEKILLERRTALRSFFAELMIEDKIVEIFRTAEDFANLRLALRRALTDKPLGKDYSLEGNLSPEIFEQVFETENYDLFPDYMARAVEQAVLAYYQKKDIRQIDFAVDAVQAENNLKMAAEISSTFLLGLFRLKIDLTNIRTLFRLKFAQSEETKVFLAGGFVETERFRQALDLDYQAVAALFFATPYQKLIETGAAYLDAEKSFLKLEQQCDDHLAGFLKSTLSITAGPQPVIAYLLAKENEIRTVRLILTAKKNRLDKKLIIDRIT